MLEGYKHLGSIKMVQNSPEEYFVIGGGSVYEQFFPYADKLYLTVIDEEFPEADTFFPKVEEKDWRIAVESDDIEENGYCYRYLILERK